MLQKQCTSIYSRDLSPLSSDSWPANPLPRSQAPAASRRCALQEHRIGIFTRPVSSDFGRTRWQAHSTCTATLSTRGIGLHDGPLDHSRTHATSHPRHDLSYSAPCAHDRPTALTRTRTHDHRARMLQERSMCIHSKTCLRRAQPASQQPLPVSLAASSPCVQTPGSRS